MKSLMNSKFHGTLRVPGDKSITHRALMFGALSAGTTRIHYPLPSEDTRRTLECMRALGRPKWRRSRKNGWSLHQVPRSFIHPKRRYIQGIPALRPACSPACSPAWAFLLKWKGMNPSRDGQWTALNAL